MEGDNGTSETERRFLLGTRPLVQTKEVTLFTGSRVPYISMRAVITLHSACWPRGEKGLSDAPLQWGVSASLATKSGLRPNSVQGALFLKCCLFSSRETPGEDISTKHPDKQDYTIEMPAWKETLPSKQVQQGEIQMNKILSYSTPFSLPEDQLSSVAQRFNAFSSDCFSLSHAPSPSSRSNCNATWRLKDPSINPTTSPSGVNSSLL